jgi:hypothetical protein
VSFTWEEPELLLVSAVPVEAHSLVAVVGQLEGHRLLFSDDAVTDGKLVLWETLKCDALRVAFTSDQNFVLLVRVVQGAECEQEAIVLCLLWRELDVKGVVGLWCDRVAEVAEEREALMLQGIKPSSCRYLAFVLQHDGEGGVSTDPGLSEPKHWGALSVRFLGLLDEESRQRAFTS